MFIFNKRYFSIALLILCIEVWIALYVHDKVIRPYIGDLLVVIFIYAVIKSFLRLPVLEAALFVLFFSFAIELLQGIQIVDKLGLSNSNVARTVIGTSFSWMDLVAYVVGIAIVLAVERARRKRRQL
jgi:hypothetical protein